MLLKLKEMNSIFKALQLFYKLIYIESHFLAKSFLLKNCFAEMTFTMVHIIRM